MDDEQYKNKIGYENRKVTSVGNAWIICHSKSYPGRIYYFNTFTGKTAWNLSEEEIEKAKRTTEILQRQPGANLRKCPEPKDQPPMESTQLCAPSKIYNKQIINNQFPSTASHHSVSINPLNALGISTLNSYNPFVWAHAPSASHTPILLVPVINQVERAVHDNNLEQSFSEQWSMPFRNNTKNINTVRKLNLGRKTYNTWHNNRVGRGGGRFVQNDLRQILLAKKKSIKALGDTCGLRADNSEEECREPEEINWKEHIQESSILDIKPLRDLADINSKLDCWYIVADAEVLLNNFAFINTLTDLDPQCYLMVPQHVMFELQCYASLSENVCAPRIVRFLSQQIKAGCAFVDGGSMENGEQKNSISFNTCLKLAKDNYHVVLISDDIKMSEFKKNTYNINIFSIQEVKNLVTNDPRKHLTTSYKSSSTFSGVKTIISNEKNKSHPVSSMEKISPIEKINKEKGKHKDNVVQKKVDSTLSKPTVNTAVQFDITRQNTLPDHTHTCSRRLEELNCMKTADSFHATEIVKSTNLTDSQSSYNKTYKSRRLRLQRNVSNKTIAKQTSEKNNFKWRRKRNVSTNCSDEPKLLSIGSKVGKANKLGIEMEQTEILTNTQDSNDEKKLTTQSTNESEDMYHKDCVESVESSIVNHKDVSKNIIIEETSSSCISNNPSNVDSKSLFSLELLCHKLRPKKVMYEITDDSMEEHLNTRCDEWVSRFVQIMEEVLREILQQDPPFQNIDLPPPWTLHEATRCIIKKFTNDYHVVDAANNLSLVLFINSDNKGNIVKNMEPSKFMEIYSYAVYLVTTLQNVATNCEDLQTAADSLKKLLFDIQNPNMDTSNNDTFADDPPDPSIILTDRTNNERSCVVVTQDDCPKNINNNNYGRGIQKETRNLRSKTRKLLQKQNEPQTLKTSNENIFFACLELKKKDTFMNDEYIKDHQNNDDYASIQKSPNKNDNLKKISCDSEEIPIGTINKPAFIRNFTKFAEFEERLRNSSKKYYELDDDFSSDYAEDFEYSTEEYLSDDCSGGKENIVEEEIIEETHDPIVKDNNDDKNKCVKSADDNKQIKLCIGMFLLEIKETFSKTHILCEKYFKELCDSGQSGVMRNVLQEKVQKAYLHIDNIYKILDSILVREMSDPENSIQNSLKNVNIANFVMDEKLSVDYRNIVKKCKDQAVSLLSTIDYINTVVET